MAIQVFNNPVVVENTCFIMGECDAQEVIPGVVAGYSAFLFILGFCNA